MANAAGSCSVVAQTTSYYHLCLHHPNSTPVSMRCWRCDNASTPCLAACAACSGICADRVYERTLWCNSAVAVNNHRVASRTVDPCQGNRKRALRPCIARDTPLAHAAAVTLAHRKAMHPAQRIRLWQCPDSTQLSCQRLVAQSEQLASTRCRVSTSAHLGSRRG